MTQEEDIKALYECVEGLSEAMEQAAKSRGIMLNLMEFEGHRIDALAKKIDILLEAEAEKRREEYHKSERERW